MSPVPRDELGLNRFLDEMETRVRMIEGRFPKNQLVDIMEGHVHRNLSASSPTPVAGPGGVYQADYVIDPNYTGTAGGIIITATGATVRAYATLSGAITHALANRTAANQDTTFYFVGGVHVVSTAQTLTPPNGGSWVFIGSGTDATEISCTQASGTAFTCSNISGAGRYVIQDLKITTTQPIKIWDCGSGNESFFNLVHFDPNNGSAVGLDAGVASNSLGTFATGCTFTGSGKGVGGSSGPVAAGSFYAGNCFFQSAVGISLGSQSGLVVVSGGRATCSTVFIDVPSSTAEIVAVSAVAVDCPGFRITGSGTILHALSFTGCTFVLSSTEIGIDFAQTTGAGSANVDGVSLVGNNFYGGASTVGIKGHASAASGPQAATVIGNSFYGFATGNEITNMHKTGDGTRVFNNISDAGAIDEFLDLPSEQYTIATGIATPQRSSFTLDAEGAGTTDDLTGLATTNLHAGSGGHMFPASGQTITVKHNAGGAGDNIRVAGAADIALVAADFDWASWYYDGTIVWVQPFSGAGGGGGYATLEDEGTALTARTIADIRGAYMSAVDDAANTQTVIRSGYPTFDAIVDREVTEHWHGRATSGAATTLSDTSARWTTDQWAGYIVKLLLQTDSGTANAAVTTTTGPPGTLTDTREAWTVNQWAGAVVTCNGKTMTVASNTATVLTGTAGWSGGGDPGAGFAWSLSLTSGEERTISSNTATQLTVSVGWSFVPDSTSVYAIGTSDRLSTATAGAATTLTEGGQAWGTNQWAKCRVVILQGTGIGQVRTVSSNTATALTVSAAWTVNPDATSIFLIQFPEPVYIRLIDAITAGHRSILMRAAGDTTDITIASTDSVNYVRGDDSVDTHLVIAVTCNKTSVIFDAVNFTGGGSTFGRLVLNAIGDVALGCRFSGAESRLTMSANGTSAIACAFASAGGVSNSPVELSGEDIRVSACAFIGGSSAACVKNIGSSSKRLSVVGCLFASAITPAATWTGYVIDIYTGSTDASCTVNGNVITSPSTATGCIRVGRLANVSGNFVRTVMAAAGTHEGMRIGGRSLVTGNLIETPGGSGASTYKGVVVDTALGFGGQGDVITGNLFVLNSPIATTTHTVKGVELEAGAGLNSVQGNLFVLVTGNGSATYYAVDPIDGTAADVVVTGNLYIGPTFANAPHPWKAMRLMGARTVYDINTDTPKVTAFKYEQIEDFIDNALPAHMTAFGTGGTQTYGGSVQGGEVTLSTAGAINQDSGVVDAQNTFVGGGANQFSAEFAWDLSSVADVRMRVGVGEIAAWVTNMGRPTDGLFVELDTAVDANLHLIMKTGAATQNISLGAATTGIHRITAYVARGGQLFAFFDGAVVTGVPSATGAFTNIVGRGAFIRQLAAGAAKELDVDFLKASCIRR